jgi:von Willebrand factor type D domain
MGTVWSDPHFTTFDGLHYDFQGVGDFLLTRSTIAGDQFDVQVRTRSIYNGAPVTIMSEAASTLCNHDVTFDVTVLARAEASFGSTVLRCRCALTTSFSLWTPAGFSSFRRSTIRWFGIRARYWTLPTPAPTLSSQLSWIHGLVFMEGLLSSDVNPDAWRVTGAASLFDPVPGPGTVTLLTTGLVALGIIRHRRAISAKAR